MAEKTSLVCDGCGASLPLPDAQGHVICPSCGRAQIIKPKEAPRTATPPTATINVDLSGLADVARPAAKASAVGCALGPIIALVVVALVGGVLFFSLRNVGDGITKGLSPTRSGSLSPVSGTGLLLPGEGSGADDIVTFAYDSKVSARRVVRVHLDGSGGKVVWQSKNFASDVYAVNLALSGKTLYVGAGDSLRALDPDTGVERWVAALSDKVKTNCANSCLTPLADGVAVVTDDGQLSAFGPDSAAARWTKTTEGVHPQLLVSGTTLALVDDKPDAAFESRVSIIDAASGTVRTTFDPRCAPAGIGASFTGAIDASNPMRFVPGTADIVAVAAGDGCAMRWDSASGAVRWNAALENKAGFAPGVLFNGTNAFQPLADGGILRIDLNTGSSVALPPASAPDIVPVAVNGNLLVVQTTTARGTPKSGLAGYDLTTNTKRWDVLYPKGSKPPSESSGDALFSGAPRSVLVAQGTTLALVTFEGDARTYAVQTIDPGNGALSASTPKSFHEDSGTPSLEVLGVESDRVVVYVDSMVLSVPLAADGELLRWPDR